MLVPIGAFTSTHTGTCRLYHPLFLQGAVHLLTRFSMDLDSRVKMWQVYCTFKIPIGASTHRKQKIRAMSLVKFIMYPVFLTVFTVCVIHHHHKWFVYYRNIFSYLSIIESIIFKIQVSTLYNTTTTIKHTYLHTAKCTVARKLCEPLYFCLSSFMVFLINFW